MSIQDPSDAVLSILIVNYNGKHFLADCFDSIKKYVSVPHEIIVLDNASHDGSVDFVKQGYPDVKIIASPLNTGFTGGNNLAAKQATGRYLLLLNNDTVMQSPIAPLIEKMEADICIGVLGCSLFYGDGLRQESIGYAPSALSLVLSWSPFAYLFPGSKMFRRTVLSESELYKQVYAEADWVSGACLLTRSALWQQLGGMDERYFMYMEDVDYCLRVKKSDYCVGYSNACEVTHFEGAGRPWVGERALINTVDSYMVYVSKFQGNTALLMLRALLAPVFAMRSVAYFVSCIMRRDLHGYEKCRAYFHAALKLARLY